VHASHGRSTPRGGLRITKHSPTGSAAIRSRAHASRSPTRGGARILGEQFLASASRGSLVGRVVELDGREVGLRQQLAVWFTFLECRCAAGGVCAASWMRSAHRVLAYELDPHHLEASVECPLHSNGTSATTTVFGPEDARTRERSTATACRGGTAAVATRSRPTACRAGNMMRSEALVSAGTGVTTVVRRNRRRPATSR